MSYFTGVLIGIVVTVFALATLLLLIMQGRVAPQSLRVALEWLIQHALTNSQAAAVIRGRRGLPSHLRDNRILINGTDVWFDDNGKFRQATIDGYHREPGRGDTTIS